MTSLWYYRISKRNLLKLNWAFFVSISRNFDQNWSNLTKICNFFQFKKVILSVWYWLTALTGAAWLPSARQLWHLTFHFSRLVQFWSQTLVFAQKWTNFDSFQGQFQIMSEVNISTPICSDRVSNILRTCTLVQFRKARSIFNTYKGDGLMSYEIVRESFGIPPTCVRCCPKWQTSGTHLILDVLELDFGFWFRKISEELFQVPIKNILEQLF